MFRRLCVFLSAFAASGFAQLDTEQNLLQMLSMILIADKSACTNSNGTATKITSGGTSVVACLRLPETATKSPDFDAAKTLFVEDTTVLAADDSDAISDGVLTAILPLLNCRACYIVNEDLGVNIGKGGFCPTAADAAKAVCAADASATCGTNPSDVCYSFTGTTSTTVTPDASGSTTGGSVNFLTGASVLSFAALSAVSFFALAA